MIIGLKQKAAGVILITQVLMYTLPGIVVGVLLSMGLYGLLAFLLNRFLLLNLPLLPHLSSFIYSILVGLFTPLVAVTPSIVHLVKEKLADSLDMQHSGVNDTRITITDNRKTPISFTLLAFGCVFVVIGVMVFVYAIEAFLNSDIKSFMMILNMIIILALLGLTICILSFTFECSIIVSIVQSNALPIVPFDQMGVHPSVYSVHSKQQPTAQESNNAVISFVYRVHHFYHLLSVSVTSSKSHALHKYQKYGPF